MKITKNSPIPKDLMTRVYAAIEPNTRAMITVGNPTDLQRQLHNIVNNIFSERGVLEFPDSYETPPAGSEFIFFMVGCLVASKLREEIDIALTVYSEN